ncbi:hypothetical protein OIU85_019940 [Salix viminalis]|uniref:Uncharacterized protein n=1 Tax=Salix viminalis TaxID=40686 RepID=A0A9Q0ZC58_SALVM|nr:hypothetical protein OIU85_019940 [Salix viminalis]
MSGSTIQLRSLAFKLQEPRNQLCAGGKELMLDDFKSYLQKVAGGCGDRESRLCRVLGWEWIDLLMALHFSAMKFAATVMECFLLAGPIPVRHATCSGNIQGFCFS